MDFDLEDLLECAVCLDTLSQQNKVLPCQHTFCTQCLQDIYDKHGYINCPECRILVPGDLQSLPPNVLLNRMLERFGIADKQSSSTNISGKGKDERNPATKQAHIKVQGSSNRQSSDKCLVTLTPSNYQNVAAQTSIKERFNCSESRTLPLPTSRHDQVVTNPNSSNTVLNTSLVPSTVLSTSLLSYQVSRSQVSSQPVTSSALSSHIFNNSVPSSSWTNSDNASLWTIMPALANSPKTVPVDTSSNSTNLRQVNPSNGGHDKFAPLRMLSSSQDQGSNTRRHTVSYNTNISGVCVEQDAGIIENRNLSLETQSLTNSTARHHVPGNLNTNPFLDVATNSNLNTQKDVRKESQVKDNVFKDWQLSPRAILNPLPAESLNQNTPGGFSSNSNSLPISRQTASASPILKTNASAIPCLLPNASANSLQPQIASENNGPGLQQQLNTTSMQNLLLIQQVIPNQQSLQNAKLNQQSLQNAQPNQQSLQHAQPNQQSLQHATPNQFSQPQNASQQLQTNVTTTRDLISDDKPNLYSNIHPTNSFNYQHNNIQTGRYIPSMNSLPVENQFGESTRPTSQLDFVSHSAVNQQHSMSQSVNSPAHVQGVYEAICDYTAKKGDEISLTRGEKYLLTEVYVDDWARGKNLRTGTSGVFPLNQLRKYSSIQGGKDELDSTSDDRLEKLKRMRETLKQNHAQSLANASTNNTSYKVMGERYRCIVPFPASSDFELSLQMGDVISLVRSREDGWCKGIQHRTGKTGLFPASFVERIG